MDDPDYKSDGSAYELDFRVGGHERFGGISPDGRTYRYDALIYDIVPDRRIGYSYETHEGKDRTSVSVTTVEIAPVPGGATLTYTEQGVLLDGIEKPGERKQGGWSFSTISAPTSRGTMRAEVDREHGEASLR